MRSRTTLAVAVAMITSLALTVVVAQASRSDGGDGPRSAYSYINPDKGAPTFNPDVDPGSNCARPDRYDSQPFSSVGTADRNVHNDACLFTSYFNRDLTRSDVNGVATFDSRGVGEISACPDPDGAGPATAKRSDTNGDGRFDRCTQSSFQQKGAAGDFEWHARMNNDGSARLGGAGEQRVKFCYDPDANGCSDESVTDDIAIQWGVPNGSSDGRSWGGYR